MVNNIRKMESHWCVTVNLTSVDVSKYYPQGITAALGISAITLVCFAFIFIDILNGYRCNKPWLPCHLFALNSITLSFVSLAARYPSDRTALMLSAEDQLCKLSGTVLICISMGFFMPSLGIEKGPEGIKNMASLTILVVAVEFNVIAQMFTGVIFSFIFEHGVVLFFMFVLLLMLWTICLEVNHGKGAFNEYKKTHFKSQEDPNTTEQMLSQLEWCYIFGYTCNPQFLLGLVTHCATIGLMCTLCTAALLEAVLGTLIFTELKHCDRSFKSKWGMQMVLGIQILTIIVGIWGIGFRWFTMVLHFKPDKTKDDSSREWFYESVYEKLYSLPWILSGTFYFKVFRLMEALLTSTMIKMAKWFESITNYLLVASLWLCKSFHEPREPGSTSTREEHFRDAIHSQGHRVFVDWILKKAVEHMDRLIEEDKKDPPRDLIQLLLRRPEEEEFVEDLVNFAAAEAKEDWGKYRVSCLSMVMLVRLVEIVIPSCSSSLTAALNECFDIIYLVDKSTYLIDKSTNENNAQDEKRFKLAEDIWMCTNFRCHWLYKKIIEPSVRRCDKQSNQTPVAAALKIIEEIMKTSNKESLRGFDLYVMAKIITIGGFYSLDELNEFLEMLFAEMLYFFIRRLPYVVKYYVFKSSVEECGDRAKYVMKIICKVQQLETRIGPMKFCKVQQLEARIGRMKFRTAELDEGSSSADSDESV